MPEIDAAVLRGPRELSYERLHLDDPNPDEVLVDVRATGVCHTDFHAYAGDSDPDYPVVLGHEGAGVVEAVGENVSRLEPGDHVVLFVLPTSDDCPYCRQGKPYLSPVRKEIDGGLLDGTSRLRDAEGERVDHFYAQSSFATKAVVPERTAIPIRDDVPFEEACLLACGATTGIGAVMNTADVKSGESVAVFGCGGVGASAVLGASAVSADPVVAVDVVDDKLATMADLGATHTVNAREEDPVERIDELVGGVDYAFECIGNPATIEQAFEVLGPGGTEVVTGTSSTGPVELDAGRFTRGVSVVGNVVGNAVPIRDIPRYADLHANGAIDLSELLTRTYSLDELDEAFEAMENGDVLRSAIVF